MKDPTLQDIADACGTNRMTVSLALRGRRGVSEAMRERVLETAERLGYRPNPLVSALMARLRGRRTPRYQATLGLIHLAPTADWTKMFPACRLFEQGLRARTARLGYGLETFWLGAEKWSRGGLERALVHRGIHGLVVAPMPPKRHEMPFAFDKFAVATIGQSLYRPELHCAAPHYFRTIELAFNRLRAAGRRRIGLVLDPDHDERTRHQWLAAFLGCQAVAGGAAGKIPPLVESLDTDRLRVWVRERRVDAVMSAELRHLDWLRESEWRIPSDLAYVCITHAPEMRARRVTGVANNPVEIAAAAVDMVVAQLHRNERGVPEEPRVLQILPRWVDGETV